MIYCNHIWVEIQCWMLLRGSYTVNIYCVICAHMGDFPKSSHINSHHSDIIISYSACKYVEISGRYCNSLSCNIPKKIFLQSCLRGAAWRLGITIFGHNTPSIQYMTVLVWKWNGITAITVKRSIHSSVSKWSCHFMLIGGTVWQSFWSHLYVYNFTILWNTH